MRLWEGLGACEGGTGLWESVEDWSAPPAVSGGLADRLWGGGLYLVREPLLRFSLSFSGVPLRGVSWEGGNSFRFRFNRGAIGPEAARSSMGRSFVVLERA